MTAEFYALKGMLQAQIGKSEEANKAFSAAVQMHDTLVKAWALWGLYLKSITVEYLVYKSHFIFQDLICHWNYIW